MRKPEFSVLVDVDDTVSSGEKVYYDTFGAIAHASDSSVELAPLKEGAKALADFFNSNPHLKLIFWTSNSVRNQLVYGQAMGLKKFWVAGHSNAPKFFCIPHNEINEYPKGMNAWVGCPKHRSFEELFRDLITAEFLWVEDSLSPDDERFLKENDLMHRHLGVGSMEPVDGSITEWKRRVKATGIDWGDHPGMFPNEKPLLPRLKERLVELGVEFEAYF